ncbi:flagellar hook-length control protein FliK [Rosenbergiella sp. S61]|uniref:Flagellar hook-length control protein FliK n=1 Tax=Rosenbergiella gaditana TaxID=2726987 RepID=A0ABS5SYL1_9GAMM|nr:flagellar hook-length control protein FliK [Rosenbergiella gaditana]MBT0725198.1 flagellar hook-length control protein FliK [Rosenbergiella gaditana]
MNVLSLTPPTSIPSATTAPSSIAAVSAQAEQPATHFLLSTGQGDSAPASETALHSSDALTDEEAQPLIDSLQAQFSYRDGADQRLANDIGSGDAQTPSWLRTPRSDTSSLSFTRRLEPKQALDDSTSSIGDDHHTEEDDGTILSNVPLFLPPIDRSLSLSPEKTSIPSVDSDNNHSTPPAALAQVPLADVIPQGEPMRGAPAGGPSSMTPTVPMKVGEQALLSLPLAMGSDHTGYGQPLVTALSGHLTWQITQQLHSAELQLHPVELGAMTITLHRNAESLQLHIRADVPETQQLLQQTANELKESLTLSQGGQVEVDVSSQGHQQRRQPPHRQNPKVLSANNLSFSDAQASATDHSILITL